MQDDDGRLVEAAYAARLVIVAKTQAYEEAISILDMVERYGVRVLPTAIAQLRTKHAALSASPKQG